MFPFLFLCIISRICCMSFGLWVPHSIRPLELSLYHPIWVHLNVFPTTYDEWWRLCCVAPCRTPIWHCRLASRTFLGLWASCWCSRMGAPLHVLYPPHMTACVRSNCNHPRFTDRLVFFWWRLIRLRSRQHAVQIRHWVNKTVRR